MDRNIREYGKRERERQRDEESNLGSLSTCVSLKFVC